MLGDDRGKQEEDETGAEDGDDLKNGEEYKETDDIRLRMRASGQVLHICCSSNSLLGTKSITYREDYEDTDNI